MTATLERVLRVNVFHVYAVINHFAKQHVEKRVFHEGHRGQRNRRRRRRRRRWFGSRGTFGGGATRGLAHGKDGGEGRADTAAHHLSRTQRDTTASVVKLFRFVFF